MPKIPKGRFYSIGYSYNWLFLSLVFVIFSLNVKCSTLSTIINSSTIQDYLDQANTKLKMNKPEEAINLLLKIKLNPTTQKEQRIAYAVHTLFGDCYSRINNKKEFAFNHYTEAKKYAEKLNDLQKLGDIYHKLGVCSIDLGKAEDAKKAFSSAITCKTRLFGNNHISTALDFNGLGNAFFYMHNLNMALENYKKALTIADKSNPNGQDNAMFSQNVGIVYATKGDYDNGGLYFKSMKFLCHYPFPPQNQFEFLLHYNNLHFVLCCVLKFRQIYLVYIYNLRL